MAHVGLRLEIWAAEGARSVEAASQTINICDGIRSRNLKLSYTTDIGLACTFYEQNRIGRFTQDGF